VFSRTQPNLVVLETGTFGKVYQTCSGFLLVILKRAIKYDFLKCNLIFDKIVV
jgi:hypothetical protein